MSLLRGIFSGSSTDMQLGSGILMTERSLTNFISSGGLESSRLSPLFKMITSVPVELGPIVHMGI